MKKTLGYMLLALAILAWAGIPVLPFIDLTLAQVAAATTFLLIAGELLFWASVVLLGEEVWKGIKSIFRRKK
ncbi:MAG: transporter suffix domain-containing protein [Pseudomonadota bacterium]